jgi:hypothetical protein
VPFFVAPVKPCSFPTLFSPTDLRLPLKRFSRYQWDTALYSSMWQVKWKTHGLAIYRPIFPEAGVCISSHIEISGEKFAFCCVSCILGCLVAPFSKRQSAIATEPREALKSQISRSNVGLSFSISDRGLVVACGIAFFSFPSLTVGSVFYRIPIQIEMRPNTKDDDI